MPDEGFATTEEAATYLRVSKDTFLRWCGRRKPPPKPGTALAGVALWLHPTQHSGELLWDWDDLRALRRIVLGMRHNGPAPDDLEEKEEKD